MKKTLLLGLTLLGGLISQAQTGPLNNVIAPDFTATDINGVEHTLSEYLNDGKIVVMDVSATWCGPCWNLHKAHSLRDLYNAYGPNGSDELVVLFVEGDPSTPEANLYGTMVGSEKPTRGDWTEGSPYPIINSAEIGDLYQINAFPTLFAICPGDGYVHTMSQDYFGGLAEQIGTICSPLTGVQNYAKVDGIETTVCDAPTSATALITNYGNNQIATLTATIKQNGAVIATETFTMDLAAGDRDYITFEDITYDAAYPYEIEVTQINEATPFSEYPEALTSEFDVDVNTNTSGNNITVTIHIDQYPTEIAWAIFDGAGNTIAVQQSYTSADANTTKTYNYNLTGEDCFTVVTLDSYGDGWTYGNAEHGFSITSGSQVVFETDGNIGYGDYYYGAFKSTGQLGNEEFVTDTFSVYPNPTSGILNFSTQETVNVTVLDLTGKVVFTADNINNGDSINLNTLQSGMYLAKINGENTERIEKIIVK